MLISEEYRALNASLHRTDPSWGRGTKRLPNIVLGLAREVQAETVLDYGAGKGMLAKLLPELKVASYDPAIADMAHEPAPADLVVCHAVLEHVEPECLDAVLDHMQRLTNVAVCIGVSCCPSGKVLGDGTSPHRIEKAIEWWLPRLMQRWLIETATNHVRSFWFVGRRK